MKLSLYMLLDKSIEAMPTTRRGILEVRGLPENWLTLWIENKLHLLGIPRSKAIKKSVEYAIRECLPHVKKDGKKLDRRYKSSSYEQPFSATALLTCQSKKSGAKGVVDPLDSPIVKEEKSSGMSGVERYSKLLKKRYHKVQDKLLSCRNLGLNQHYYSKHSGKDSTRWLNISDSSTLSPEDFCSVIDEQVTKFSFNQPALKSISDASSAWFGEVLEVVKEAAYCRNEMQLIESNFLDISDDKQNWERHVKVIVSFMAAVAVLIYKVEFERSKGIRKRWTKSRTLYDNTCTDPLIIISIVSIIIVFLFSLVYTS